MLPRYGGESDGVALDRWAAKVAAAQGADEGAICEIAGECSRPRRGARCAPANCWRRTRLYPAFADRFPIRKPTIRTAIGDVLADMASGKPMDRLVCGDVGFGKTEVALRAAFVAAMAGVQVAVVVPTTLLARQHYTNFVERFKGFPVNIGRLSRLVPAGEAQKTRDGLASGQIDIVVGTHAVIAKSVEFKQLGLVIVDEEQRFGVVHKERLKQLKADVHVLTLTATPIPRTLQMAMSGLRELSVIQTPPVDRLAVRTYVAPWDAVVLREALLREHDRGGQSFFVVPRIKDLPDIEEFLRNRVPEVKYVVAHGQMTPTEVEDRMSAFYDRKYDVLLSTTIVESGLDIPSANTLHHPPRRPFRPSPSCTSCAAGSDAARRAYAYHHPRTWRDHRHRRKRLKLLGDLDTLGAGFQLASTISTFAARATRRRRAVRAYPRGRLRAVPVDAGRGDPGRQGRRRGRSCRRASAVADDHVRCADPDPRGLCPRPAAAHGALPPPQRCRGPPRARRLCRRDDRPLRPAAARNREPGPADGDQGQCEAAGIAKLDVGPRARSSAFTATSSRTSPG